MKTLNLFKSIALALSCAVLSMTTTPAQAGVLKGHAGTTFLLIPATFDQNGNPTSFTHTVDGVVRVFEIGNCTFHADVIAVPHPDGSFSLSGTFLITSANGATTLNADAVGRVTIDPATPLFGNFHYDVKFTGGTGQMAGVRGSGDVDGFAMFTSQTTGKATWLLQGNVNTHGHDRR
jgi:hypothetical protein